MRYMGGKSRIAKHLAAVIDEHREPGQLVWDAFCGGLSMSVALSKKGPVYSTDICAPLIALYKAVQNGWDPPTEVSKETWEAAKKLPDSDPMKAFCGFGCSFGGKWFGGYAKCTRPDRAKGYAGGSAKVLTRDREKFGKFDHIDFCSMCPSPTRTILYCDPPYKGTTSYNGGPQFDYNKFMELVQQWSHHTDVFVSEYDFPLGKVVFEKAQVTTVARDKGRYTNATERLYHIPKDSL